MHAKEKTPYSSGIQWRTRAHVIILEKKKKKSIAFYSQNFTFYHDNNNNCIKNNDIENYNDADA